jgi:hypothetical protein
MPKQQEAIVYEETEAFVRGLIHSDAVASSPMIAG